MRRLLLYMPRDGCTHLQKQLDSFSTLVRCYHVGNWDPSLKSSTTAMACRWYPLVDAASCIHQSHSVRPSHKRSQHLQAELISDYQYQILCDCFAISSNLLLLFKQYRVLLPQALQAPFLLQQCRKHPLSKI